MKKLDTRTFEAYKVTVRMEGTIEQYALNFLKIFNNVREQEDLISVCNNSGNDVSVVCKESVLEATKEFLSWFGNVWDVDKVLCLSIEEDVDYDYDKYEDLIIVPYME